MPSPRPLRNSKICAPQVHALVERERLYGLLDSAAERPITWIAAPPGSGKTLLTAGYLLSRQSPTLWLQVDAEDDDPAVLFENLALLLQSARKKKPLPQLPVYQAEYAADLDRFAAQFAREAAKLFAPESIVVIDNFQDAQGAAFISIMHTLFGAWSDATRLLVLSRAEPPAQFAPLRVRRLIANLVPADLAFDQAETARLMGLSEQQRDIADTVQQMTGGWAAGIVLAGEYLQQHGDAVLALRSATRDAFLGYFAPEVLSAILDADRHTLYCAAHLTRFTPAAVTAISGRDDVAPLLANLHARHLFTDLRNPIGPVYTFHALFREFLLAQAEQNCLPAQLDALRVKVAAYLEQADDTGGAVRWYKRVRDWEGALRVISHALATAAEQARHATLLDWIADIPPAEIESDARLALHIGEAYLALARPAEARRWMEISAAQFEVQGETALLALALARLTEALYVEGLDYRRIESTLARLKPLLATADSLAPRECILVLRVAFTMVRMNLLSMDEGRRYEDVLARLVETCKDANVQVAAATTLLRFMSADDGERGRAEPYVAMGRVVERPEVTPLNRLDWLGIAGHYHCWREIDVAEGERLLAEAERIGEQFGLEHTGAYLRMMHDRVEGLSYAPDITALVEALEKLKRITPPDSRHNWAYYRFFYGSYQMRIKDFLGAAVSLQAALDLGRETGLPHQELLTIIAKRGFALMGSGDFQEALAICDELIPHSTAVAHIRFRKTGIYALMALRENKTSTVQMAEQLRAFFHEAQRSVKFTFWQWNPELVAELACAALRYGVEQDFVLDLIRHRELAAPADAPATWPWPLRVECFGGFKLFLKGEALSLGGKPPAKPLALLKLLAAEGGEPVQVTRLRAALWPDGEDDRAAFDMAFGRLKKLLDVGDAIALDGGSIALSAADTWLDTRAFNATLRAINQMTGPDAGPWHNAAAETLATMLLALYRGPFLPDESEIPWIISAREQFQQRFVRAADQLGQALEQHGETTLAQTLYERAIDVEPLAEHVYCCLMRCYHRGGRAADAIRVYRRCRQMLSVMLGMEPAKETDALMRSIYDGQSE